MPEQQRFTRKQSRSKRSRRPEDDAPEQRNGSKNGGGSDYEQALAEYLQERIKPGLNRGAIPLLARSIAKDLANGGSQRRLAEYLQDRIKPGLNRGAIPLLARSIAKDLLNGSANGGSGHEPEERDEPRRKDEPKRKDEPRRQEEPRADDGAEFDFEAEMHDLQAELGEDWIVRFSVWNDEAWLTAEKADGTQHVEAQTAAVLVKTAKLLNKRGVPARS